MPTRGNPRRAFRVDDKLWEEFRVAAEANGWDRGSLLHDFAEWYTREPERATYRRKPGPPPARRRPNPDAAD